MADPLHLAVIGAGPGGYVAAFHAADLGLKVTLIDKSANPGGVCLYRGCIPSKAMLHAARLMAESREAADCGITFSGLALDTDKLRSWKNNIIQRLTGGLGQLTRQRKINYIQGEARFLSPGSLEVVRNDGSIETVDFDKVIIATGSRPIVLPFMPLSERIWDSTSALDLPCLPKSLLVIGGRYIGLELGMAYAGLGSKVSVVEATEELLGGADRDLAEVVIKNIKRQFSEVMTSTKVTASLEVPDGVEITFQDRNGKSFTKTYERILCAVGRRPNHEGLALDKAGIQVNARGFIEVNERRQTAVENIYAIGDIAGDPMLAHKASAEARVAVEAAAGGKTAYEPKAIPAVVFTDPELAWTGLTEQEARDKGINITVFKFPWAASGRAMTLGRTDGLTKVIAQTETQRIIGVGIAGVGAGDLISEGTLAIEMGAVADDLALTIHPHPTLSETMMETAEGLFGHSAHILRPKK